MSASVAGGRTRPGGRENGEKNRDGRFAEIKEIARRCYSPESLPAHSAARATSYLPSITISHSASLMPEHISLVFTFDCFLDKCIVIHFIIIFIIRTLRFIQHQAYQHLRI